MIEYNLYNYLCNYAALPRATMIMTITIIIIIIIIVISKGVITIIVTIIHSIT